MATPWLAATWLAAAEQIKFDDRSIQLAPMFRELTTSGERWDEGDAGVIADLKDFDGGVEITFKRVTEMREDCLTGSRPAESPASPPPVIRCSSASARSGAR
jgi:hypothetical protein